MKAPHFQDQPSAFPRTQADGQMLKSLTQILIERRATAHFEPDPVPGEFLEAILRFGAQAPSGFNLQPWRFIVVQNQQNRDRLQKAAMNQAKVGEAPVVIIAFGVKGEWKETMGATFDEAVRRGAFPKEHVEKAKATINSFLGNFPAPVWLNRHTMIAFTTMMLVAEAYGLDTAPMEGFDPEAVKKEFKLPPESEIVALLAIGFAREPDKEYGGRLALDEFVYSEEYGRRWTTKT